MSYATDNSRGDERLLTPRTVGVALGLHLLLFLVIGICGWVLARPPEVVIPIDMTIVPPWAEQTKDPDPDPNPPPKPQPKPPPKPQPKPPEPTPKLEETKQDAVIKEKPKPKKKEIKRGEFKKDKKVIKTPPKKDPPDFRKDAKLVKVPPMRETGKATAQDKPLTEEEFRRLMNQGYKIGTKNQLAPNEESRCVSLVAAALKRHWVEEFHWTEGLVSVYLELTFGPGGTLRSYRIVRSSGDAQVDQSVLAAAKATGSVAGLSPDFVRKYSSAPFVLEMKPIRQ